MCLWYRVNLAFKVPQESQVLQEKKEQEDQRLACLHYNFTSNLDLLQNAIFGYI